MGNMGASKSTTDELKIAIGDRIGMSFNQGDLEHEQYGRALNVSGIIPLLCPFGTYKRPPVLQEKEKLNILVRKMTAENTFWEDELDEEISSKLRDFILFGAHTLNIDDIESNQLLTYIHFVILIFAVDDLCDQLTEGSSKSLKYNDIKKMNQFLIDIFDGVYASVEEMPNPIKAIECMNAFIWKTKTMCEDFVPGWAEKNKWVKQEWVNTLSSWVLYTEKSEECQFSDTSLVLFSAYQAASSGYLELVALIKNLTISDEIREDILFQRMRQAGGSVSNLLNDLFGLERDMKLGQITDSTILRKVVEKGMDLQDAVAAAVKNLCDEINDVKLCANKLRACYGEDKDLEEYIISLERMLDGQLYWYEHTERYKESNLKVVKV